MRYCATRAAMSTDARASQTAPSSPSSGSRAIAMSGCCMKGSPLDQQAASSPPHAVKTSSPGSPVGERSWHRKATRGWKCVALSLVAGIVLSACGQSTTATVPDDCKAAIQDARRIAAATSKAFDAASKYPPLVPRAAIAGATNDTRELDRIAQRMKTLTRRVQRAGDRATAQIDTFNAHAAGCQND